MAALNPPYCQRPILASSFAILCRGGAIAVAFLFLFVSNGLGLPQVSPPDQQDTLVIESSPDMEIVSFSKRVIVKNEAKGVLVFGSDVIVEGRVTGDVAAIGGSIIQKQGSFIGGDVIVVGGKYAPEALEPLRGENKQTIIFAAYEEELRNLAQNPLQIFAPSFTVAFFALRAVSLLFWFIISMLFTTIAPGAVSRAVSRLTVSSGKVIAVGFFAFVASNVLVFASLTTLPTSVNAVVVAMTVLMLTLAYAFGRVALHVTFGKLIQKYFLSDRERSESLSILLGVLLWTVVLSVPYLWTLGLLALFSAGIGLVLLGRSAPDWKNS